MYLHLLMKDNHYSSVNLFTDLKLPKTQNLNVLISIHINCYIVSTQKRLHLAIWRNMQEYEE